MQTVRLVAAATAVLLALPAGADAAERRPRVAIGTKPGSVLLGLPAGGGRGEGTAAAGAGVARVRVLWCGNGQYLAGGGWTCGSGFVTPVVSYDATVTCATVARTSCTWSAPAPVQPSRYLLFAIATDAAGRYDVAGPVDVVVV
ncbi:MAG TPA: hypothetical protein VNA20_16700 [Frankiaceae bacterium]|nr:hypothetical protein [Frankiaceae bacterium]